MDKSDVVVTCCISDERVMAMDLVVPLAVQIRLLLNNEGFRFEDDDRLGLIFNENPSPLGVLSMYRDCEAMETHYKQRLGA